MSDATPWSEGSALLLMDFQNEIVAGIPQPRREPVLEKAAALLASARKHGTPVFYVVVHFRDGYPEVNPRNKSFSAAKAAGRLLASSPGSHVHDSLKPREGELVVVKCRVGAFSTTALDTLLAARSLHTLVLAGLHTSGVVLSTVRWAADKDYALTVVRDACADPDEEVHRVLIDKVFPRQCRMVDTADLTG